ncbi:50S ribosomal protein L15 [Candidatus Peregrinibacteria bacterium]|nr:50S ribosomal protein L15 [Candidatus Peregrinibacteria bacterium]
MYIHDLKPNKKSRRKRIGRGNGSGHGTYAGKGVKGQNARKGSKGPRFEGGQTPLLRRMPKLKGFKSPKQIKYKIINIGTLDKYFENGEVVNVETLYAKKLIDKKTQSVKILGSGELTKKLKIEVPISKKASEKISS